jgi:hypothetical protein
MAMMNATAARKKQRSKLGVAKTGVFRTTRQQEEKRKVVVVADIL